MGNTGYKSFASLELYYTDDNSYAGSTKPNIVTDPDYIAPILDIINCAPTPRYYNEEMTRSATKNNCNSGYSGTAVTLTALANQFVSNVSVTDANNQAIAWLDNSVQIHANNAGTCVLDTIPPNAPTITSSLSSDEMTINVSWTIPSDNVGVTGYQLWRKDTQTGSVWSLFRTISSPSVTSFPDNGLTHSTTYYYKVRATDAASNWSEFSNETNQTAADSSPGSGGGGTGCLVEGTLITLPDGSKKAIEELHLDQLLLSAEIETLIDTNNASELYKWSSESLSESRITSPITRITEKIAYKTMVINNGLFEATPTHLQLIQRDGFWRFIPLGDIMVGDNLYTINNEIIPVTSVTINLEERKIYPLTLNPFHTYFANGILTHNFKEEMNP